MEEELTVEDMIYEIAEKRLERVDQQELFDVFTETERNYLMGESDDEIIRIYKEEVNKDYK